ncbi:MAG: hypothetical protein ACOYK7_04005, partial [Pirellulales bacterium]
TGSAAGLTGSAARLTGSAAGQREALGPTTAPQAPATASHPARRHITAADRPRREKLPESIIPAVYPAAARKRQPDPRGGQRCCRSRAPGVTVERPR